MPMGTSTYGSKVGRPAKKMTTKKTKKMTSKTSLKGLKVGSKEYMQALRNRKK